jgi:hypothetical protein
MKKIITSCAFLFACFFAIATETQGASSTVEGFDGGTDGGFIGNVFFEAAGGNPDGNARHLAPDLFFNSLRTGGLNEPANPNFLGDYSSYSSVTFGFDVRTDVLRNFNGPISREIGIALRDRDLQGPNGDAGIFFTFKTPLNEALQDDWTTYSVTIDDPNSPTLPSGWIGFGDDDPNTFEPILPTGASFASVLASVDEFEITGAIPGFFFGPANMDIRIDNVTVTVPEPSGCLLVFLGLLAASRSRL